MFHYKLSQDVKAISNLEIHVDDITAADCSEKAEKARSVKHSSD